MQSEQDILVKLQHKVLRIIFDCKRTDDALRHNNLQISSIMQLYCNVINRLCFKHHTGLLPCNFGNKIMPEFNIDQLQKRVTRISLDQMYNYKNTYTSMNTNFKANCVKFWNILPKETKALPYSSSKQALFNKFKL